MFVSISVNFPMVPSTFAQASLLMKSTMATLLPTMTGWILSLGLSLKTCLPICPLLVTSPSAPPPSLMPILCMMSLLVNQPLGSSISSTKHPELGSAPARVKSKQPPMAPSSWLLVRLSNKSLIFDTLSKCLVSLWMDLHGSLVTIRLSLTAPLFSTRPSQNVGMPCPTITVTKLSLPVLSTLNSYPAMRTPVTFLQRTSPGPKLTHLLNLSFSGKVELCLYVVMKIPI